MKKGFIYTGGEIFPQYITEHPEDGDLVIAADSGYNNAKKMGVKVGILVGDFDSIGREIPSDVPEILKLPTKKDLTDTQLAVEKAVKEGATDITIIGGLSGRLDHTLSTLAMLENLRERGIRGTVVNGQSRAVYIKNTNHIIMRGDYKYFSLIATDTAKGVSIEGAVYPLKNKTLERKLQYAVSNEVEGNCALVTVKKGGLYIIESRDI